MKAVVRDDIIALDSFVAAEFKYKAYLEMLMKSGNYCFLDQFKKLVAGGQAIVNGMIENNLIGMENINKNYKYIYLSDTAMKYLYLRESEEDYSNVTKNRISVKKVNKHPTEKQLLSSAYKFHLLVTGEDLIDKESIMKSLEDYIFLKSIKANKEKYESWRENNNNGIKNIKKEIEGLKKEKQKIDSDFEKLNNGLNLFDSYNDESRYKELTLKCSNLEKEIKEKSQKTFKTGLKELNLELELLNNLKNEVYSRIQLKNMAKENLNKIVSPVILNISNKENHLIEFENKFNKLNKDVEEKLIPRVKEVQKVFENLYNISKVIARIKDNKLEFIILDNGNFKTAYGYLKQINSIKSLDLDIKEVKIIIYSYAEHRAYNLYNEFLKAEESKAKAQKTMRNFNIKTENASKKSDFYIAAKKVYDNTPDFEVEMRDDFFYMKKYMDFISSSTKSIKRKDKEAIDNLIEKLKNKD